MFPHTKKDSFPNVHRRPSKNLFVLMLSLLRFLHYREIIAYLIINNTDSITVSTFNSFTLPVNNLIKV